jgi:hypothetical protein
MKLILTPTDKKALLIAAVLLAIILGTMKIVLHFAPMVQVSN